MARQTISANPTLIIFVGGQGDSPAEQMVGGAQRAIAFDTVERARASGAFERIIVATDSAELADRIGPAATVELDSAPFHFGKRLRELIHDYDVKLPFYIGGGAGALFSADDLAGIAERLISAENTVITNNLFSADLAAFTPASAIERIELPAIDNSLAQLLRREAGLEDVQLERNVATQFDVDTPADLLVLQVHRKAGRHTQDFLSTLSLDVSRLRAAMQYFTDPLAEVLVAGRVGSYVWAHLEKESACRIRLLSEERGMRADGREEKGAVRSVLGYLLQSVGMERFFQALGQMGQAAFIDTRVLFGHLGLKLSGNDRFLSDLGEPEGIVDSFVREFTAMSLAAPIPIVLGGHSLVAGGLWAIVDAAWLDHDERTSAT
ncbi:MAG: hypothetical protein HYX94_00400 [Chloroflexi bacterium]|nr:hypothetical protein [Chloroflexota bacterium]